MAHDNKKGFKLSSYAVVVILFLISVGVLLGIRTTIDRYMVIEQQEYETERRITFIDVVNGAISSGKAGVDSASQTLQATIHDKLDLVKLRNCFENSTDYPEFSEVMRNVLQTNVYTKYCNMNPSNNNIVVLVNNRIVASYTHNTEFYPKRAGLDSTLMIEDIIEADDNYNHELCRDAIEKVITQYDGLIVWQYDTPSIPNMPKYTSMDINDIYDVFKKFGINGLESYEILIPAYITEYGNVFGEYDVPGQTSRTNNNKIIILQKLNLKDYIQARFPTLFDETFRQNNVARYNVITNLVNTLIILVCASMIAYAVEFVSIYNHNVMVWQMEADAQEQGCDDTEK